MGARHDDGSWESSPLRETDKWGPEVLWGLRFDAQADKAGVQATWAGGLEDWERLPGRADAASS